MQFLEGIYTAKNPRSLASYMEVDVPNLADGNFIICFFKNNKHVIQESRPPRSNLNDERDVYTYFNADKILNNNLDKVIMIYLTDKQISFETDIKDEFAILLVKYNPAEGGTDILYINTRLKTYDYLLSKTFLAHISMIKNIFNDIKHTLKFINLFGVTHKQLHLPIYLIVIMFNLNKDLDEFLEEAETFDKNEVYFKQLEKYLVDGLGGKDVKDMFAKKIEMFENFDTYLFKKNEQEKKEKKEKKKQEKVMKKIEDQTETIYQADGGNTDAIMDDLKGRLRFNAGF